MKRTGIIAFLALLALSGCGNKNPIAIGFVADLSGSTSDLGVQGRNAVELAVEEINGNGGISGRKLHLHIEDCGDSPEDIPSAVEALLDNGVSAIIGPMTSSQTSIAKDLVDGTDVVMISPTASSPALSGLDDQLLRMAAANVYESRLLARVAYQDGIREMAVIRDTDNDSFTSTFESGFSGAFSGDGGQISSSLTYSSSSQPDFLKLAEELVLSGPEGVTIISSALDTAIIAQRLHALNPDLKLYSSGWANTADTLIPHGGKAVEGLKMVSRSACGIDYPEYKAFSAAYEERFSLPVSNPAEYAYEAVLVLKEAFLQLEDNEENMKDLILEIGEYKGLQGTYRFDEFGDPARPLCILEVRDGTFASLGTIEL